MMFGLYLTSIAAQVLPSIQSVGTPGTSPKRSNPLEPLKSAESYVKIKPGEFQMGATSDGPIHRVRITRWFEMGKYEVTQAQWKAVMGNNPSHFKNCDNCPVEQVSWDDVQQFLSRLNAKSDGYFYRLPTEAEWEYACRAGTTGEYAGNIQEMAWFDANSGNKTHAVGTKAANAWGLFDVHGNVWEWVQDWYGEYSAEEVEDPKGASSGSFRVLRGGSWIVPAAYLRSAFRLWYAPETSIFNLGFRLVRTNR